jgi:ribonuclease-3 family protein
MLQNFDFFTTISVEQAKVLSPVTLAFVGDAVYSLYVREKLVLMHDQPAALLQKYTSAQVSAHGQSELLNTLIPLFNEDEEGVYKRGRNAKKATKSKNASVAEYNRSTGFEAVLGFLYLSGQYKRIDFLLGAQAQKIAQENTQEQIEKAQENTQDKTEKNTRERAQEENK